MLTVQVLLTTEVQATEVRQDHTGLRQVVQDHLQGAVTEVAHLREALVVLTQEVAQVVREVPAVLIQEVALAVPEVRAAQVLREVQVEVADHQVVEEDNHTGSYKKYLLTKS